METYNMNVNLEVSSEEVKHEAGEVVRNTVAEWWHISGDRINLNDDEIEDIMKIYQAEMCDDCYVYNIESQNVSENFWNFLLGFYYAKCKFSQPGKQYLFYKDYLSGVSDNIKIKLEKKRKIRILAVAMELQNPDYLDVFCRLRDELVESIYNMCPEDIKRDYEITNDVDNLVECMWDIYEELYDRGDKLLKIPFFKNEYDYIMDRYNNGIIYELEKQDIDKVELDNLIRKFYADLPEEVNGDICDPRHDYVSYVFEAYYFGYIIGRQIYKSNEISANDILVKETEVDENSQKDFLVYARKQYDKLCKEINDKNFEKIVALYLKERGYEADIVKGKNYRNYIGNDFIDFMFGYMYASFVLSDDNNINIDEISYMDAADYLDNVDFEDLDGYDIEELEAAEFDLEGIDEFATGLELDFSENGYSNENFEGYENEEEYLLNEMDLFDKDMNSIDDFIENVFNDSSEPN